MNDSSLAREGRRCFFAPPLEAISGFEVERVVVSNLSHASCFFSGDIDASKSKATFS